MNLGDLQPYVASRLAAYPALAGVPVVMHDGTDGFFTTSNDRSAAVTSPTVGACLTVFQISPEPVIQGSGTGDGFTPILSIGIGVLIEVNVRIAETTGLPVKAENLLQFCMQAIVGPIVTPTGPEPSGAGIGLAEPPFDHLGNINGLSKIIAAFQLPVTLTIES